MTESTSVDTKRDRPPVPSVTQMESDILSAGSDDPIYTLFGSPSKVAGIGEEKPVLPIPESTNDHSKPSDFKSADEESDEASRFFPKAQEFLAKNTELVKGASEMRSRLNDVILLASPLTNETVSSGAGDS